MNKGFIIAIDGPVASGKGTIARHLADRLGGFDLYTGATYRCLALYLIEKGIDFSNLEAILDALKNVVVDLTDRKVLLNDQDVTERIKKEDVASKTPLVAALVPIRRAMVDLQRQIAQHAISEGKIVVAEGRDTGTVVFPHAELKIYLTATDRVRARRRLDQYQAQGDMRDYEKVLDEIQARDKYDKEREADPLPNNPEDLGYFILDNSQMNEKQTLDTIVEELKKRELLV